MWMHSFDIEVKLEVVCSRHVTKVLGSSFCQTNTSLSSVQMPENVAAKVMSRNAVYKNALATLYTATDVGAAMHKMSVGLGGAPPLVSATPPVGCAAPPPKVP